MLAAQFLPEDLERVLYLGPDVLIINSLKPLWELEMGDFLFAAASHTGKTEIANSVNRLRLGTDRNYYNSGVLLMELGSCRRAIVPEDVFRFVEDHAAELVLPTRMFSTLCTGQGFWKSMISAGIMTHGIIRVTICAAQETPIWSG